MAQVSTHENVERILAICTNPKCLVMELMEGASTLEHWLETTLQQVAGAQTSGDGVRASHNLLGPAQLEEAVSDPAFTSPLLDLLRQVAKGMAYLHGCAPPVLHRDLKADNVLVNTEGRAVVCDFGLSRFRDDDKAKL